MLPKINIHEMQLMGNVIITMTKKILVIDDETDLTYTLEKVLEDNGFKVDSFNDPILALDNYKAKFYDLIILDIKMPKINGYELYIKLREKDPKVKICFLTAITTFKEDFRKTRLEMGKTDDLIQAFEVDSQGFISSLQDLCDFITEEVPLGGNLAFVSDRLFVLGGQVGITEDRINEILDCLEEVFDEDFPREIIIDSLTAQQMWKSEIIA